MGKVRDAAAQAYADRQARKLQEAVAARRKAARRGQMSAKDAEAYAQDKAREAAERAARRRAGGNLAAQSAKWQGKPKPAGPAPARSLYQEGRARQRQQQQRQRRKRRAKPRKPNPGGYRTDDPRHQERSPYYAIGVEDATRDCEIVANCPPGMPLGPDSERCWSFMYRRGYDDKIADANPHKCGPECRKNGTG